MKWPYKLLLCMSLSLWIEALAGEKSATLRLQGVVPARMGITLSGGQARFRWPYGSKRADEGFLELARLNVHSNAGTGYAVYVSSDNGSTLKAGSRAGGEELPYELTQGETDQRLELKKGKEVQAWLSSPDNRGIAESGHSLQVRLRPKASSSSARAPAQAPQDGDRPLLRDTVRLTIVSF